MKKVDEGLTPEAVRQHLEVMLLQHNIVNSNVKAIMKITTMWAYNQGLKARDSVKASDKL